MLYYILLTVYIIAVNFYSFYLIKAQRDDWEEGGSVYSKQDGKLILIALLGGATALYATMLVMKFRLSNMLLMVLLPVLAVLNYYLFFLSYRGIYLFF